MVVNINFVYDLVIFDAWTDIFTKLSFIFEAEQEVLGSDFKKTLFLTLPTD